MHITVPNASQVVQSARLAAWYLSNTQWHSCYALLVLMRIQTERMCKAA